MATLALAAAGAAVGSAVLPAGVSVLGVTLSGAAIGSQFGALAGSYIDQALFGPSGEHRTVEGPRLREIHLSSSTEGSPIPRIYGRTRLGGQVIWASDFEEVVTRTTETTGGGGGKGGGPPENTVTNVSYSYFANFAIALCEGKIGGIGRVWADGRELNMSRIAHRIYKGSESQDPDALIESFEGNGNVPAYRGVAYVVFERLALADFGNRLPQLSFEVFREIDGIGKKLKAVVTIPGSGEFVYSPDAVVQEFGGGYTEPENVHTRQGSTDWEAGIDQLQETLTGLKHTSFVVSWFGTDLRAGHCEIKPGIEFDGKVTSPINWSVAGVSRSNAYIVSRREGEPAYGGTPSDQTVVAAIEDLKARGIKVMLTPFVLMDVPDSNGLPDPYGAAQQAVYPWRGRITCDPAPGLPGSPDKTAAAASQIANFVGTAQPSDFSLSGKTVVYTGPNEWSYRRMILHQAYLAKAAGGVNSFLIGTELRGLTWVRDGAGSYPFVSALVQLADDVKSVLGSSTKVSYAADWSEYFGHQPADGSGDVYFHLDPLWASNDIDAVAIDCYWPLSDWRDGTSHLDYQAGTRSTYDLDYLRSNIRGGEGFDWYYASDADRNGQLRTPITDGSGKPWVFRYKDIKSWWQNQHFNRPGGVESATPTAWQPESKPFWLTELGCPAADKGANQPNVFVDPKSSENALPYYSRGTRDDLIQRRYIEAVVDGLDPQADEYVSGSNPSSSVYSGRMVDIDRIYIYCWDARPYPAFPFNTEVWSDGENWRLGHWITGRFSAAPLSETVEAILGDYGFEDFEAGGLDGIVPGFIIDRPMSPREALQPLSLAYFFDALESGGSIVFRHRGQEPDVATFDEKNFVETRPEVPLGTFTRAQETDLPASAKLSYIAARGDYEQAVAEARRLVGASGRLAQAELPIVLNSDQASQIAESWLFEAWASRERAQLQVAPRHLGLEPGDVIKINREGLQRSYRITEIGDHGARDIAALSIDAEIYGRAPAPERDVPAPAPILVGQPQVTFLDLPMLRGSENPLAGYIAARQTPWPGAINIFGSPEETGYLLRATATAPAVIGTTIDDLSSGPLSRIDNGTSLRVHVPGAELLSQTRLQMLGGLNAAAIKSDGGEWEVIQFETATLTGTETYELVGLLRGQAGTEPAMMSGATAGATFVVLNGAPAAIELTHGEVGAPYNWRHGPANRDIGDASYGQSLYAFTGLGLRPFSPVHIRATRQGGDIQISWTRRTRIGGDSWEAAEVPLGEDLEAYEIDILDGADVRRTIAASSPSATYLQADQIADFGAPQSSVSVAVYQMSAVYGRGAGATATL